MTQATKIPSVLASDADLIWSDLGATNADEMLSHVRSDNRALDTLRLALECDAQCDNGSTLIPELCR
ncbi:MULTISPECIES: hypothetical protein [unclassified Aureimonas]|uniref:hypothetical protein n=1 Tax=unclassified Aureimonas TaxID=2615206 RepID=UPI000721225D|nr:MULTISPECIES: hypothetical protein [unclassified Aureimonas]ALN73451.1 hypothetical protein M673_12065 [Aureimonas sp. AU20]